MSRNPSRLSRFAGYSDLFERLLDTALLLDFDHFIIKDANSASERILAVDSEELVGSELLKWIDLGDHDSVQKTLRVSKRRYYPVQLNCFWITKDGRKVLMEMVVCALELSNGEKAVQVIARDITREWEAEQKIAKYLQELQELNKKFEKLSVTDELTKLPNVRQFKSRLDEEHRKAVRSKKPYSIIFCDADNFKHYNDRNGHPVGDELLKQLADVLQQNCRELDLPARYGGEEFVILCPELSNDAAYVMAEKIRKAVEGFPFAHAQHQPLGKVSISVGVATYLEDGRSPDIVLKAADDAVYASKKGGRNRTTCHKNLKSETKKAA